MESDTTPIHVVKDPAFAIEEILWDFDFERVALILTCMGCSKTTADLEMEAKQLLDRAGETIDSALESTSILRSEHFLAIQHQGIFDLIFNPCGFQDWNSPSSIYFD